MEEILQMKKHFVECPNRHVVWLVKTAVEKTKLQTFCPHCGSAMTVK